MRAGSLSDDMVASILRSEFVSTWKDISNEPGAAKAFLLDPDTPAFPLFRGVAPDNVQVLVLTPEGRILWAIGGYVGAAELAAELRLAWRLFEGVEASATPADAKGLVAAVHRAAADALAGDAGPAGFGLETTRQKGIRKSAQDRRRHDHRFVAEKPLLPVEEFRISDFAYRVVSGPGPSPGTAHADAQGPALRGWRDLLRDLYRGR